MLMPTAQRLIHRLLLAALLCSSFASSQKAPAPKDDYRASIATFRQQKETDLRKPDGWLSVVGLEWLPEGVSNAYLRADGTLGTQSPSQPVPAGGTLLMTIELKDQKVWLHNVFVDVLKLNSVTVPYDMKPPKPPSELHYATDTQKVDVLTYKTYIIFVIRRGDKFGLRVKNNAAPARRDFKGMVWYDVDMKYRVEARYIAYKEPRTLQVPTQINIPAPMPSPGHVEFTLDGKSYSLDAVIEDPEPKELFFIFKDQTATHGTYGAGRFLYTPVPSRGIHQDGTVTLDFNRAENPPCAVTPYATCPIPPKQNQLPVAIPAGEQYHGSH